MLKRKKLLQPTMSHWKNNFFWGTRFSVLGCSVEGEKKMLGWRKAAYIHHCLVFFSSQKNHRVISENLCGSWTLKVPETKLIKNSSMQVARRSCCSQPLSLKWNREVLHSGSAQHRCSLLFIIFFWGGLHNGQMVTEGLGFAIKDLFKCTARHLKLLERKETHQWSVEGHPFRQKNPKTSCASLFRHLLEPLTQIYGVEHRKIGTVADIGS